FEAQLSSSDFPNSYSGNQSSRTTSALSAFFGLSYGTTYYVRVLTANWVGVESGFLSSVSTVTLGLPPVPWALAGTALGISSVSWSWAHAGARDGYFIVSSSGGILSDHLSSGSTSWVEPGLSTNTMHGRSIAAFNTVGASTTSLVSVYTLAATPAQFIPITVHVTSMTLQWLSEGNPLGTTYYMEHWTAGGSTTTTSFDVTTAALTGLFSSTTYFLRLRARNGDAIYSQETSLSTATPAAAISSQTISYESATVIFVPVRGEIRLDIPAGSFAETVSVVLKEPSSVPSPAHQSGEFTATGAAVDIGNDRNFQPLKEVTLTMSYRDEDIAGLNEARLIVARYDLEESIWVPLVSETNADHNKVTARTKHFSVFQVMQASPASALDAPRAFPNPFRPLWGHSSITLSNLPSGTSIKIYSLSGSLVREMSANASGMASWDGLTASGEKAASGVYFVFFDAAGKSKTVKIAVER
ncbi:MAG: T9SS type A sorting domain-containing protein, partial [Elusimicrobia bacterium]|nr:T9SS type A sorting domain-containing protein [Elusimicrobiota bacterium]